MIPDWLDWAEVGLLGGIVGAGELIPRYRDAPEDVLRTWPTALYVAINAGASVGALGLMHSNGWFDQSRWVRNLLAGIGAMAFFRTSHFVVRAGGP